MITEDFKFDIYSFMSKHFPNKCYVVGGYVRDEFLGVPSNDLDIVIEENGGAERAGKLIVQWFGHENVTVFQAGESYPIWKAYFKEYDETIDIADTQSESFPDSKSRQRITKYASLEEDVKRRDFTINSLMYDITNDCYKDMANSIVALRAGVIDCHPDVNPVDMFIDDPLRIIRMYRFSIKYNFSISPRIKQAVACTYMKLDNISAERKYDELMKICKCDMGLYKFVADDSIRHTVIKNMFPWIIDMVYTPQHPLDNLDIRNIHCEGKTVWSHVLECLKHTAGYSPLEQIAVLFHDIGKIKTIQMTDDMCRFPDHDDVGVDMATRYLKDLKFSNDEIKCISEAIKYHMSFKQMSSFKSIRRFLRKIDMDNLDLMVNVAKADHKGCHYKYENAQLKADLKFNQLILDIYTEATRDVPKKRNESILSGREIMNILKIDPGRKVGRLKSFLMDQMDGNPDMTSDEAVKLIINYKDIV